MKLFKYSTLSKEEKNLIQKAFDASNHSVTKAGHKVGCAVLCKNDDIFVGATNARSRAIGSTCAERMAADQLFFHGNKQPVLCATVGFLKREKWTKNNICTPCGVCLEMFWEMLIEFDMQDMEFICCSWNKKRVLKAKFTELYPRVEAVRR